MMNPSLAVAPQSTSPPEIRLALTARLPRSLICSNVIVLLINASWCPFAFVRQRTTGMPLSRVLRCFICLVKSCSHRKTYSIAFTKRIELCINEFMSFFWSDTGTVTYRSCDGWTPSRLIPIWRKLDSTKFFICDSWKPGPISMPQHWFPKSLLLWCLQ